MSILNDDRLIEKAEIIREKGTDRSKFFRGEIDKYSWVHHNYHRRLSRHSYTRNWKKRMLSRENGGLFLIIVMIN